MNKEGRVYVGERAARGCRVLAVDPAGSAYELPRPGRHRPDGFEWGYGGSGPADLAWALLADAVGAQVADELYQRFKWDVVARVAPLWVRAAGRGRAVLGGGPGRGGCAGVKEAFDLEAIRAGLFGLPQEIANLTRQAFEVRERYRDLKLAAEEAEIRTAAEVAAEVDGAGKPRYPNEARRAAEVRRRLSENADYAACRQRLEAARRELDDLEVRQKLAEMRFAAWRHWARLVAAALVWEVEYRDAL